MADDASFTPSSTTLSRRGLLRTGAVAGGGFFISWGLTAAGAVAKGLGPMELNAYIRIGVDGSITMGGYSSNYVVDERFAHTVPSNLDLAAVAPLLCAGITTYSPLRHWKVGPGKKVGIVGLGGLGHMGLKFAHSFGAHTVQLTTSLKKKDDAIKLGADEVIVSTDEAQMKKHAGTFDFILDTASAPHALEPYLGLLKQDGTLTLVGLPDKPPAVSVFSLITKRASIGGSMIGGIAETQEMLDFCAEHDVRPEIEVIQPDYINEAYERVLASDVRYRFVIDTAALRS